MSIKKGNAMGDMVHYTRMSSLDESDVNDLCRMILNLSGSVDVLTQTVETVNTIMDNRLSKLELNTGNKEETKEEHKEENEGGEPSQAKARITRIEPLTSDIKSVTVKITKGNVCFEAGQFMGVYDGRRTGLDVGNSIFPGTYSVASPPSALPFITFAIGQDNNPRSLRNFLYNQAKVGDPIMLDQKGSGTVAISPRMVMTPMGGPGGLVLIGGGSAVMGLVSIVEELLSDKEGQKIPSITLIHSNRSNTNVPFYERMTRLDKEIAQFHYKLFITGDTMGPSESPRGAVGRVGVRDLVNVIPGARLFCVCGSGVFCEAMVNSLLNLGVWPGSIRTDYTTRVDPARKLQEIDAAKVHQTSSTRFESCSDATQSKGTMVSTDSGQNYLKTYGIDILLSKIASRLEEEKPDYPLEFLKDEIQKAQEVLPEISNSNAGDPEFWINYYETDMVTWQAPVVSPWLVKYLPDLVGSSSASKRVFVPLCGKSLDLKFLLDNGHHVIGADCSGIACQDFFKENDIPDYIQEVVAHPEGKRIVRHKSKSLPIELYEGDIFDLTPTIIGGTVDAVLDRAALVALPPQIIQNQYLPHITKLLNKQAGGKVLFASVAELPFPKAPPHTYEQNMIESILACFFSKIELKETHRYRVNAGYVSEPIYLLENGGDDDELGAWC